MSSPRGRLGAPRAHPRLSVARRLLRLLTSPVTLLRATGVLVLAGLAAGAASLLPPADVAGELPGDEALGTFAVQTVKANRDYIIPDPQATAALKEDAARAVRPVYDFDLTAADAAAARIAQSFAYMRERLEQSLRERRPGRGRRTREAEPTREELEAAALLHLDGFMRLLQAVVTEGELRALAAERFNPDLERAAVMLTRSALSEEIAPSRELLLVERENGITVRALGGPRRIEREVRDVERIPDVAAVRTSLIRLAQGMGDLPGSAGRVGRFSLMLPPEVSTATRRNAATIATHLVAPTLTYNATETRSRKAAAAAAVKPVVLQYARGEKIIGDGERIEARHLQVFRHIREHARALDDVQVRAGAALLVGLLAATVYRLARRTIPRFRPGKRDLVFLSAALLGNLALLRATLACWEAARDRLPQLTPELSLYLLPLAAGPMLVRMLRSGESSVVFLLIYAPLAALLLSTHTPMLVGLVASVVAANRIGRRPGRRGLVWASGEAAFAGALTVTALALFGGRLMFPETALHAGAAAFGVGVLSPLVAAAAAPLVESLFGYTSESQLARLANFNHPVLKELIIRAPGTYHHSLLVGQLAEAAAERIGAHPLLAKVGGYYHDLGKERNPLMFAENQKTENRLETLAPETAADVLRAHVRDGLERGQQARLPKAVLDFIAQHHGDRLAEGFFRRACDFAAEQGILPPPEEMFRYPGPKPRSREVGLVMLADAVEAASRPLVEPSEEELRAVVEKVVRDLIADGQLDECDLSLADVREAIAAFQDAIVQVHGMARVDVLKPARHTPAGSEEEPPVRLVR